MKKFLTVIGIIVAVILIWYILGNVSPISYSECLEQSFYEETILFESEDIEFGNDKGKIITSIGTNDEDFYSVFVVNETDGWLNNQFQCVISFTYYKEALDDALKDGNDVSDYLTVLNDGDETGCYIGIVPLTCKSLSFDGIKANLEEQTAIVRS
ncbi:MAG: hypothetical protein ACI4IQ_00970, partial [Eubacterium sp.]